MIIHEIVQLISIDPKSISICKVCDGSGKRIPNAGDDEIDCYHCQGTGRRQLIFIKAHIEVPFNYKIP